MSVADAQIPTKEENDLGFDAGLKKKKKKKAVNFDDLEGAEEGAEATPDASKPAEDDMFSGIKKKSKKKSSEATEESTADAGDDEFADLKKKKKSSSKKKALDLDAFDKELEQGTSQPSAADSSDNHLDPLSEATGENGEPWLGTDRDYTYKELLSRTFKLLHSQNPALVTGAKRYTIAPPQVVRDGNKKTAFANIADICKKMHRQPEHVIQFLFAELGTSGSVDGSQRLVIRGRFQQKQIENVLRRYIIEYVTCKTCKSPETNLTKENRLYFMTCESCGSRRSVAAIKSGFQAQIGKRRAQVK
ncbi:hypothetical protein E3P99_00472 [Wallemia hederae]|uniref:Translation initiation factor IF2/IF5 domain-containing protein n=1 Tax=Wallemia hederae TaxID=1540922 RepID=A0A4T0FWZ9_9BASI|nr:hypothetical protein E3P99_00472 [Wallemia hederae]